MLLSKQVILNVSVPWKFQLTYSKNLESFYLSKTNLESFPILFVVSSWGIN
jgi:hypothetical protein